MMMNATAQRTGPRPGPQAYRKDQMFPDDFAAARIGHTVATCRYAFDATISG
jgi:hypothetical protein